MATDGKDDRITADLDALRQHLDDARVALEFASRAANAAHGDQLFHPAAQVVTDQIYDASRAVSIAIAAARRGGDV